MVGQSQKQGTRYHPPREEEATPVKEVRSETAAPRPVSASLAAARLAEFQPMRKGWSIYNGSTGILFLLMQDDGSAVGTRLYSIQVAAGGYFEMPYQYCGEVWGVWGTLTAGDLAMITEYR